MKLDLTEITSKFEGMQVRERVLLFLFAVVGPICIWDYLYLEPLNNEQADVSSHVMELRSLVDLQTAGAKEAVNSASKDPDRTVREQLSRLQERINASHNKLKSLTDDLITPEQMATVLQDILKSDSGLKLVSLENLPTVAMGVDDTLDNAPVETPVNATPALLYQHTLKMEFEGSFEAAQDYLQALENMPWQLYWDAIEFDVVEYPVARVRMTVHTLSLGEGWIGV